MSSERFHRPRRHRLSIGPSARDALAGLAGGLGLDRRNMPRLIRKSFLALTVEPPEADDEIVEENGIELLAISREVAEEVGSQDGHIEFEETLDGGAEFKIIVDETS